MDTCPVSVIDAETPVEKKDNVLVPLDIGNGAKELVMLELGLPELIDIVVADGPPGMPENGVVEVTLLLVA